MSTLPWPSWARRDRPGRPRPGAVILVLLAVVASGTLVVRELVADEPTKAPGLGKPEPKGPPEEERLLMQERRRAEDTFAAPVRVVAVDEISDLIGPESINDTHERWNVHGTDLGHMFRHDDRTYLVFGDTFGEPGGGEWRSNTIAWVTDDDPSEGFRFEGMIEGPDGNARELLPSEKIEGLEKTVIPTYGHAVGDRMLLHYMSVAQWNQPGDWDVNYSGLAWSDDDGHTWYKHPTATWSGLGNFAQVAFVEHEDFLYLFGIPAGRFGAVHLARVPPEQALEPAAYRYWNGSDWVPGEYSAAPIVQPPVGELSVAWNPHHRLWMMAYHDEQREGIVLRTAESMIGPWSEPILIVSALDYPQLYAPYFVPGGSDGPDVYFTMSQYTPYHVLLMRVTLLRRDDLQTSPEVDSR